MSRSRLAEVTGLIVLAVALAILLGLGLYAAATANVAKCGKQDVSVQVSWLLVGLGLVGFLLGRALGRVRRSLRPEEARGPDAVHTTAWLQGVVALVLTFGVLLLVYETYAVGHSLQAPPITSYVRCAVAHQLGLASLTTALLSGLLGHWLWYPGR